MTYIRANAPQVNRELRVKFLLWIKGLDRGAVDSALLPHFRDELVVADCAVADHYEHCRTALIDLPCRAARQDLVEDLHIELGESIGGACVAEHDHPQYGQRLS